MINTKEPDNDVQKRIMEHMPYLNLLTEDIREVNRALREGRSGIAETKNLLSDIPIKWCSEIQPSINLLNQTHSKKAAYYEQFSEKGFKNSTKEWANKNQIIAGRDWSISIKTLVLSVLDSKDILLLTKKIPEGKMFKIDEEDDEND